MYVQLTVKEVGVIGATAAQSVMQEPKLRPILSLKTQQDQEARVKQPMPPKDPKPVTPMHAHQIVKVLGAHMAAAAQLVVVVNRLQHSLLKQV